MLSLEIPNIIFEQMVVQTRAEAPIEACGILAGRESRVEKLYKMTNADRRSDHFMMEPKEQFKMIKDIREAGLEMLAIYHSHPETPARPSSEDLRLALTPDVTYVIVSLANGDHPAMKGFLIEKGSVTEVPVKITEQ
ncbi:MAG: M67 family metallopeptidase [Planctomycetota bacterium]|jgi:proteasome lid subunit RPN8/RPN11